MLITRFELKIILYDFEMTLFKKIIVSLSAHIQRSGKKEKKKMSPSMTGVFLYKIKRSGNIGL